jgi:hypothetical protein
LHLDYLGGAWCDEEELNDTTDDPRDATCSECLKRAAAYGAAAAMRYAAVEAGATRDPELARERDEAIRRVNAINDALEGQQAFFCVGCLTLCRIGNRALNVNATSWCADCAPHGSRARAT